VPGVDLEEQDAVQDAVDLVAVAVEELAEAV
jgi:hypothetical protein